MSQKFTAQSDNLIPLGSVAGAAAPAATSTLDGFTLAAGTWYVELSASEGPLADAWLAAVCTSFSAALSATYTIESTCYPSFYQGVGQGRADVTSWQAASNRWFPESPAAGSVISAGGASNAYSAPTFTAGGVAAGGFLAYIANAGARRYRLKIVVTTQGTMRIGMCAKD